MPLTLRYPTRPLQLLVFDDSGIYQQPLAESLATGQIKVESVYVHTVQAFQAALSNEWDAFVVAFPVADVALARLRDTAPIRRMILLYSSAEEEDAFALATEELCDLLAHDQLRRLPLLLRREWQLKESQAGLFALHQLERSFRGIVDGFGDAILFTDADQLVRYANSALERLYGYQSSSLLGKPFTTFVPPAEQATIQHLLANLLRCAGTIETVTHRFHHANGDWAYVETTGHSMPDPTGHLFIVLHLRDISDRKRTEETLLESEQRLRLFVEHAPAAIAMFDREMKYLSVSRRWLTDYRISETNIIGRSHYEIFPNLSPQWHTIHQRCLQGAVAKSEADPFPRADGTVDWVHWEIYPWRNKLCEIGGIVLFSEVITERKRAQEAEREQRLLAEAMRDSLAALTASTDVETVMQQILDYSTRVVPSEAGAIILFTEGQARIAYMRGHSPEAEAFFNANPNLFDMAIYQKSNGGQTYYLAADTLHTPDWHIFPTTAWIRSSLGVQIVLHGEPIGLLTADSAMPNQYAQKDVETLQTFARYAALALERVHHVTLLEQRVRERTVELEAAKTRVEAILDNSPDGILLIDANLVIQQSNGAFHQLFHCTAADCRNQSLLTFIHPEDTSSLQQLMQMVVAEKQSKYIEIRATPADGLDFDIGLSIGPIRGGDVVCVMRDISVRKAQERQLRYHASLQESVSDAVIVADMTLQVQSWNKAAERIYGWTAEEAHQRSITELLQTAFALPTDRAQNLHHLYEQGWWQGEVTQRHKDGTLRYVLNSTTLLRDANDSPYSIIAVNHDITERKQAEEALRQSVAEIHDLYNRAPCGYHSIDEQGVIVQINDTELQWLGYAREEVIGKIKITALFTAESVLRFQQHYALFMERGWINDLEFDLVSKDGTVRHILLNATAIYDDTGQYKQSRSTLFDITELRRAQQAIVESEARYRLLAENAFDMVSRHNLRGDFIYVSPSIERLLGYRPAEVVGHPGFELLHPDEGEQMGALMQRAGQLPDESLQQLFQARHKAGHYLILEITLRAIFAKETGAVVEYVSSARDVTEQKQAEAALRASEEKFRQVAENFDHLLYIRSADNEQQLFINSVAEQLTGIPRGQLLASQQVFLDHVHPDDLAHVRQQLASPKYRIEGLSDLEYRFVRPDGQIRWFRARTFPIKDEYGNIASRVGTGEDITERKQAELTLQESEAKYRLLVETMNSGLIVYDTENRMTYVNDRFCDILGYPREALLGATLFDCLEIGTLDTVQAQFEHRHQAESSSAEMAFRRKDGQLAYTLALSSPLHDQAGNYSGGFAVVNDITAQKQAEAALRTALEREKELNELKSRFVSIASHEFRTPLATISATTETIRFYRDRLDQSQLDTRVNKILAQVHFMKEIMDDVLQLERIQTGRLHLQLETGDLQVLCQEIVEEFKSLPQYCERLVYDKCDAPIHFRFDRRLMRHVVSNLIANGLKYSPSETTVTIALSQDSETLTLQIQDHGIGIPAADLKHIFEPFHRATNVGTISGTGLGLSITKEAVERHGGRIDLVTAVDVGTTVRVTLPSKSVE